MNVAMRHGQEVYDQEQRELGKLKQKEKVPDAVPGRDLKSQRNKRAVVNTNQKVVKTLTNCENDPECLDKFNRSPVLDSPNRDLTEFMKVGKDRELLQVVDSSELNKTGEI